MPGEAVDEVRRKMQREGTDLKGSLWSLRGNEWSLSEEQRQTRAGLAVKYHGQAHYHIVLATPPANLSAAMGWFQTKFNGSLQPQSAPQRASLPGTLQRAGGGQEEGYMRRRSRRADVSPPTGKMQIRATPAQHKQRTRRKLKDGMPQLPGNYNCR